jgi:hypothetical protein
MDRQNGIAAVVFPAEHLLDLAGLYLLVERIQALREIGVDRLTGIGPLDEHGQIVHALLERHGEVAILLEPPAALQDLLSFGLVFPEVRRGSPRLEAG